LLTDVLAPDDIVCGSDDTDDDAIPLVASLVAALVDGDDPLSIVDGVEAAVVTSDDEDGGGEDTDVAAVSGGGEAVVVRKGVAATSPLTVLVLSLVFSSVTPFSFFSSSSPLPLSLSVVVTLFGVRLVVAARRALIGNDGNVPLDDGGGRGRRLLLLPLLGGRDDDGVERVVNNANCSLDGGGGAVTNDNGSDNDEPIARHAT
jgi:hypothetical protein